MVKKAYITLWVKLECRVYQEHTSMDQRSFTVLLQPPTLWAKSWVRTSFDHLSLYNFSCMINPMIKYSPWKSNILKRSAFKVQTQIIFTVQPDLNSNVLYVIRPSMRKGHSGVNPCCYSPDRWALSGSSVSLTNPCKLNVMLLIKVPAFTYKQHLQYPYYAPVLIFLVCCVQQCR